MFSWDIEKNGEWYQLLGKQLGKLEIPVTPEKIKQSILLDNTLDYIAESYDGAEIKDDFLLFTKDDVFSMIYYQSFLCIYSLEVDEPEIYEYLINYEGNKEDDAVTIALYLAEKLGKKVEDPEEEIDEEGDASNNVNGDFIAFTPENLKELEELARSISQDEIRTAMNVVFDFGGAYENMTVPITPGQTATIPFTGREEIKTQIIFKPYIFGVDNYTFEVTAKLEGMYTGKNGQGTKVYNSDGTMTKEIENAGGYGTWNKLYAYYGDYTPIEV